MVRAAMFTQVGEVTEEHLLGRRENAGPSQTLRQRLAISAERCNVVVVLMGVVMKSAD